jgi:membrane protease YdiL (CAAX protease family)
VVETTAVPASLVPPDPRELGALVWTFGANTIVHRVLPNATHIPANLIAAGGALGIALSAGASAEDLGLDIAQLGRGARVGVAAGAVIASGVALAAALPATRGHFSDRRVREVSDRRAGYELFVRIPFGTALAEELLFRSALTALFAQRRSPPIAAAVSAAVFGLWHVLPTVDTIDSHPAGDRVATRSQRVTATAGVVASTAFAGLMFSWLQRRARSVLAPVIAHAVLNGSTYAATRLLASAR